MGKKSKTLGKLERQNAILAEVRASPAVRIAKLAERFAVSTETIRRDLDEMSERGLLSRTYGGAAGPPLALTKAIIGASRLDAEGASDVVSTSAWIKRVMIEQAEQVILAVDRSKFEQRAFESVCTLDSLDYLATEGQPPPALARALAKAGVDVRVGTRTA